MDFFLRVYPPRVQRGGDTPNEKKTQKDAV